jgi:hypothetical protein
MSLKQSIMGLQLDCLLEATKGLVNYHAANGRGMVTDIQANMNAQLLEVEKMKFDFISCQATGIQIDENNLAVDPNDIFEFISKHLLKFIEMHKKNQYPLTRSAGGPYGMILRLEYLTHTPPADELEMMAPLEFDLIWPGGFFNFTDIKLRTYGGIATGTIKEMYKSILPPSQVICNSAWDSAKRHLLSQIQDFENEKTKVNEE